MPLLVLGAAVPAVMPQKSTDKCAVHKNRTVCDADTECTWCLCGALPSACWTFADAEKLPAGVFICDKNVTAAPHMAEIPAVPAVKKSTDKCAVHANRTVCDADTECTWCLCGALPSACWTFADAEKLPAGVYICDKNVTAAPHMPEIPAVPAVMPQKSTDKCAVHKNRTVCDADTECTWCLCGALPSACWTFADAEKLPAGVYICDKNVTAAPHMPEIPAVPAVMPQKSTDKCAVHKNRTVCDADTECTWCLCGALPSACWTFADAEKLPASVFICDKNVTAAPHMAEIPAVPAVPAVKKSTDKCAVHANRTVCDADTECTWCLCGALPSACWTFADAEKLPAGVYICDKNVTAAPHMPEIPAVPAVMPQKSTDKCAVHKNRTVCDADTECTWCLCGALPSACWTFADAEKLPASVFICDKNVTAAPHMAEIPAVPAVPAVKKSTDKCAVHKDRTVCDADTECTWCLCGALPSACWTFADAEKLPAGVFICDKNVTAAPHAL